MSPLGGNSSLYTTEVGFLVRKEFASRTSCFRECLRIVLFLLPLIVSFKVTSSNGSSMIVRGSSLSFELRLTLRSLGSPAFTCFGTVVKEWHMLGRTIPNVNSPIESKHQNSDTSFLMNHHLLPVC